MNKPSLFIASSVEGLTVADAINLNLDHDTQNTLWRAGTFKLGSDSLGDLARKSSVVDFAVFVFTPDDLVTIRKKEEYVARDNVVFELGLFIGSLGRDRCYVVKPRGIEMHLPSDLLGVTTADYVSDRSDGDLTSALNAACKQIKDRIHELGAIRRSPLAENLPNQRLANPPNYQLELIDLKFLAFCVRSHVANPTGISYNYIQREIKDEPDYKISLSAVKLMRLGYVEKSVETDDYHGEEFFAYRATEDGLDIFLKHENTYALLHGSQVKKSVGKPPSNASRVASGFDDMDDKTPF